MADNVDWEFVKALGARIVELRKKQGLTQVDLAVKISMERTQLGRIERGEINTTVSAVKRIAEGLGVSFENLFN